jgi:hypothetical protein
MMTYVHFSFSHSNKVDDNFTKSTLVLKEPHDFLPLLGYIYRGQQERLIAIADEIMEIERMAEMSIFIFYFKNVL